ncbi:MAG: thiamine phosphate synthase, partial [Litorimonas sp.]
YGVDNRQKLASQLRSIDGLTLLIGNDPDLARIVGADGVHMPRVTSASEIDKIRNQHKDWIITQAAPKADSIIDPADFNTANIDALFVSPVFPSKSPSALNPIGIDALRSIAHNTSVPIYALGGISQETAPHLLKSGIAGLAAIEGIIKEIVMGKIMVEQTSYGHRLVYRKQGHTEAELTMMKVDEGLFNGNHTGVPKSMGGQGVGKALIKVMSDHAREHGYKVIPSCPFIAAMFKRKPAWGKDVWAKGI